MSLKKDIIGAEVQIGSNEAQKSLTELAQKTSALAGENDRLRISQAKLKALGKESSEEYKKVTAAIAANSKEIKTNQGQMDALRKTLGLSDMSMKQLRAQATNLRRELSGMNEGADPTRWKKLNSELKATQTQMDKVSSRIGQTKGAMSALGKLLPVIGFAAIAAGVKSLITNIINVRKEFEKYEAVLTNTLGSNKAARKEMQMLQKFAAETPFALTELTGAFVKLTNYGLKPSKDEMRKYGDVAASVGKGFDQFAEAMADAVTGEFERLKEFGIKAKKEGDKITFTFKEQSTVIDNNATSIKNYISGLGDLQGVSGSMAAIAATLGGKISNMGDAWAGLMNTMGSGTSGIMVTVIGWMTSFINTLDGAFRSIKMIKDSVKDQTVVDSMNNAMVEIDTITKSLVKNGMTQSAAYKHAIELYDKSIEASITSTQASFIGATENQKHELAKRLNLLIEERKAVKENLGAIDALRQKQEDAEAAKRNTKAYKKGASDTAVALLDEANNDRMALLTIRYEKEGWTDAKFKTEQMAAELAYLIQKQALLEQFGQSTIQVEAQISKKRIDAQKMLNDILIDGDKELIKQMEDSAKADEKAVAESLKNAEKTTKLLEKSKDKEQKLLKERQKNYMDFGQAAGESFAALMLDNEATLKDYLKATLLLALEALHQYMLIEEAKALVKGIEGGPVGIGIALAKIVAMEAAYNVVKGLLSSKGKKDGGYGETGANDNQPAGIYHVNEFIASAPAVRNPTVKPILDIIDMAQRSGTIGSLNLSAIVPGRQTGGFGFSSSSGSTSTAPTIIQSSGGMSNESLTRWEKIADRFEQMELNVSIKDVDDKLTKRKLREKQSTL